MIKAVEDREKPMDQNMEEVLVEFQRLATRLEQVILIKRREKNGSYRG